MTNRVGSSEPTRSLLNTVAFETWRDAEKNERRTWTHEDPLDQKVERDYNSVSRVCYELVIGKLALKL